MQERKTIVRCATGYRTPLYMKRAGRACFFLGIANGYWAVFVTVASEQFGTNLRATVTTTAPNFVRAAVSPMSLTFLWLSANRGWGVVNAAMAVGLTTLVFAFWSLAYMDETHGKDLDFLEVS